MTDIKTIEGDFTSGKGKYALVVGRWDSFVVEHLLEGALDTLRRHGVDDRQISIVRAPGAFEIPLVCKKVAAKGDTDAIIALGAIATSSSALSSICHIRDITRIGKSAAIPWPRVRSSGLMVGSSAASGVILITLTQ